MLIWLICPTCLGGLFWRIIEGLERFSRMPTVQERLATIETKLDFICKSLEEIKSNHLIHIYERLEALERCSEVNRSWTRFAKPIVTGTIVSAISILLTYYFAMIC